MQIRYPTRRPRRMPMTSLVDVVFVLLFFLMLAMQLEDHRALSTALSAASPAASGSARRLELEPGGYLRLDGERRTLSDIEASLRLSPVEIVVVPSAGVPMQDIVDLVDYLKPTGATLLLGLP